MTKETEVQVEEKEVKVSQKAEKKAVTNIADAKKAKNIKKLTVAELKKESKKLDVQGEMTINIGGTDYTISYDKIFRKTKQRDVLQDTLHFFQEIGEKNMGQLEMASAYTALLIVKHFTSLDVSDDIQEALDLLQVLTDIDVLGEIVNELPEAEVIKIYELLTNTVNTLKENIEMAEKELELIQDEIENEELLELTEAQEAELAFEADTVVEEVKEEVVAEEVVEEDVK